MNDLALRHEKTLLAERDGGWFCGYCSLIFDDGSGKQYPCSVDHIEPKSSHKKGLESLDNKVLTCYFCNGAKLHRPLEEFLSYLRAVGREDQIGKYVLQIEQKRRKASE